MKNPCAFRVNPASAYEVWQDDSGWTWKVLKKYQTPENEKSNPHARWFCLVISPQCPQGEMGDCYAHEVQASAHRVA